MNCSQALVIYQQQTFSYSQIFLEYLKKVEGYKLKKYDSAEGGLPTIGIGHKYQAGEVIKDTITE